MELTLAILKYLTGALSPVEFLVVLALVATFAFLAIQWALKRKKSLMSIFKPENESLKMLHKRIDGIATKQQVDAAIARLELITRHQLEENSTAIKSLTKSFVEVSELRAEIVDNEFAALKQQQAILLSTLQDNSTDQTRIAIQVDNLDEFMKAAIPEFRAYHRELGSDVKLLGRDLALIERSISLAINTGTAAVKLR